MVLDLPAVSEVGVQVDGGSRKWRFLLDSANVFILEPQQFAEGESALYYVVCAGLSQSEHNNSEDAPPELPEGFKDSEDVFSNEETSLLMCSWTRGM